jgi:hypothetical protein
MSTPSLGSHAHGIIRVQLSLFVVALAMLAVSSASTKGPRFLSDDPLTRVPESQDAFGAQPWDIGLLYELSYNLFVTQGYKPSGTRARNVNTIDEVPDSSWFTNRIATTSLSADQIARGPNVGAPRTLPTGSSSARSPLERTRDSRRETPMAKRGSLRSIRPAILKARRRRSKLPQRSSGLSDTTRSKLSSRHSIRSTRRSIRKRLAVDRTARGRRMSRTTSTRFSNALPVTPTAHIGSLRAA